MPRILYLTDLEGRGGLLRSFVARSSDVRFDQTGALEFSNPHAHFVFGGDALDRGPDGLWILKTLVAFKDRYPDRVTLIAGNRDINKLRFATEGFASFDMKWALNYMNASKAFSMRGAELALLNSRVPTDREIFKSLKADVKPDGPLFQYLERAQLAYHQGETLIVHGVASDSSLGSLPGTRAYVPDLDEWVTRLNGWYKNQIANFKEKPFSRGRGNLFSYHSNPRGVVYGRYTGLYGDPELPGLRARIWLSQNGIKRVVVGHTPQGEVVSWLRDIGLGIDFALVDTSYSDSLVEAIFQGEVSRVITTLADGRRIDQSVRMGEGQLNFAGFRIRGKNMVVVGREILPDESLGRWIGRSRVPDTFKMDLVPVPADEISPDDLILPWSCTGLLTNS